MKNVRARLVAIAASTAIASTLVVAPAPVIAHHDNTGAVVGGLIAGAVLGAALTATQPPVQQRYYYGDPSYYPPPPAPPPYPPPYTPVRSVEIEAGPIWNQADAQGKCPGVCRSNRMVWNGNWRTTVPGQMSVCSCSR